MTGAGLPGVPVWPGIFDGDYAHCLCSWSFLGGRRQVKVRSALCPVRHTVGEPRPAVGDGGSGAGGKPAAAP